MAVGIDTVPRGPVRAELNFYAPPADGSQPINWAGDNPHNNFGDDLHETTIDDVRGREAEFTLDKDAFAIITNVPPSKETAFTDDESIKQNYYPELEELLLKHIPGSNRVLFFDHTIRRADPKASRHPVKRVHIDRTSTPF